MKQNLRSEWSCFTHLLIGPVAGRNFPHTKTALFELLCMSIVSFSSTIICISPNLMKVSMQKVYFICWDNTVFKMNTLCWFSVINNSTCFVFLCCSLNKWRKWSNIYFYNKINFTANSSIMTLIISDAFTSLSTSLLI